MVGDGVFPSCPPPPLMADDDQVTVVCLKVSSSGLVVTNSAKTTCVMCGDPIWISPSGQEIVQEKGAQTICTDCALVGADPKEVEIQPITAKQKEEIARESSQEHAEWSERFINRLREIHQQAKQEEE